MIWNEDHTMPNYQPPALRHYYPAIGSAWRDWAMGPMILWLDVYDNANRQTMV